jgi:hypothetical protein
MGDSSYTSNIKPYPIIRLNNPSTGEHKLHALRAFLESWKLLSDEEKRVVIMALDH